MQFTLDSFKEELSKCVRCGTCRSVCPVLRVTGKETGAARGKLTLIAAHQRGELEANEAYLKHIKECTLCGACKENCPNSIPTPDIIAAARIDYAQKQGMPLAASLVFKGLLDSSKIMPFAIKLASRLQGVFFKDAATDTGLVSRFSLPLVGGGRLVPPLAKTFFLELPEVRSLPASMKDKAVGKRVAFYAGCGVNFLLPDVGTASLNVLKKAGAEVAVPLSQVCCGMPAFSSGDISTAKAMTLKNLEVFEALECDYITTSCATCGYGLKKLFKKLLEDEGPEMRKRVDSFISKVKDINELLVNELEYKPEGKAVEKKLVTYHDPCHLGRAQGVRGEPRDLIKGKDGLSLKEMRFPCSCCGLGGSLTVSNYELSMEVFKRKAESIRDTGAQVVATSCPGCIVQLRDGLHRYGVDVKVAHVMELL